MNQQEQNWANEVAKQIAEKVNVTAARSADKIPYTTVEGVWSIRACSYISSMVEQSLTA